MQAVQNIINRIDKIVFETQDNTAIKCDINILNRLLNGGFSKGDLFVIAGKESVGKTSFITSLTGDIICKKTDAVRVGIITINNSEERFMERLVSNLSGIWLEVIIRGRLEHHSRQRVEYFYKADEFNRIELFAPGFITLNQLIDTCTIWATEKNVQIIFIDYLQLITVEEISNNDLKIFTLSKALKKLAVDLNIPIVVSVPLHSAKTFSDLKDLRKTGAVEFFADVIMFLNKQLPDHQPINDNKQEVILSIQKNNTGFTDNIRLRAAKHVQKFTEFD